MVYFLFTLLFHLHHCSSCSSNVYWLVCLLQFSLLRIFSILHIFLFIFCLHCWQCCCLATYTLPNCAAFTCNISTQPATICKCVCMYVVDYRWLCAMCRYLIRWMHTYIHTYILICMCAYVYVVSIVQLTAVSANKVFILVFRFVVLFISSVTWADVLATFASLHLIFNIFLPAKYFTTLWVKQAPYLNIFLISSTFKTRAKNIF